MIVLIDNYDSFTYNLYQSVAKNYPDVKVIRNDKITVDEIARLNPEAIIISPGPGRPEDAGICIELIQKLGSNIPILGVCLGHQAIVMAYGGEVVQAPEIFHGKKDMIFHHRKNLYEHMPLPFEVGRYHSLIADRDTLPDELIIEAENADGIIMGVKHATFSVYGIQFHPESILTPHGDEFLDTFVKSARPSEHIS